ncbi:MAG: leucine-rich repeat protein [Ruminococcus sp.]|nr:leucine-rich repeat protein [Ruminococcus sp.]
MKKLLSLFTAFSMAAIAIHGFTPARARAASYTVGSYTLTYTVSGTTAAVTDCSGSGTSLEIPEAIGSYTVASISSNAFAELSGLIDVTIPDSVVSIGEYSFWNCAALTSVSIGSGTAEIGSYAFSACPRLASISVSSSNSTYTSVSGMLYSKDETSLICYAGGNTAVLPENTLTIGKAAFFCNTTLESVTLPSSLTSIGDYAFSGCFTLGKISIPISVTSMGKGCFMNCTSLTQAVLGAGLNEIPEECFSSCTAIETLNIPTSIETIGDSAFYGCHKITGLYIPATVLSLGEYSIGIRYNIRSGKNEPISGFYISGNTGSAAEKYAKSNGIDFLDFSSIPYGDTDGSGNVDAIDASMVLAEYARTATNSASEFTFYQTTVSDFNGDSIIDAVDASLILSYYAKNAVSGG